MEKVNPYPGTEENPSIEAVKTEFIKIETFVESETEMEVQHAEKSLNVKTETVGTSRRYAFVDCGRNVNEQYKVFNTTAQPLISQVKKTKRTRRSRRGKLDETNMPVLCRLCASPHANMIHILGENESDEAVLKKIQWCLPITVEKTDTLSKEVCRSCLQKLESCYEFCKIVTEAEKQLLEFRNLVSGRRRKRIQDNSNDSGDKSSVEEITCQICKETFDTIIECHRHASIHAFIDNYPCSFCIRLFATEELWKDHWLQCDISNKIIKEQREKEFRKKFTEEQNSNDDHKPKIKEYHCEKCSKFFETEDSLQEHILLLHTRRKISSCDICGTHFRTEEEINTHQEKHPLQCTLCSKKCTDNDAFQIHKQNCITNQKFTCKYCGDIFHDKSKLKHHIKTHSEEKNPFSCYFCTRTFGIKRFRDHHHRIHTGDRPFSCDFCPKTFTLKRLREGHRKIHTDGRPYGCDLCSKTFALKTTRDYHRKIHTNERTFKCDLCTKAFVRRGIRDAHQKSHTNERPFSCEVCAKTFKRKAARDIHRKIHTQVRPFGCEFCIKTFKSKSTRDNHRRVHTGDRPFACDLCPKTYTLKRTRDEHRIVHTGKRPFSCDLCPKTFAFKSSRESHRKIHSDERPFSCDFCTETFSRKNTRDNHHRIHVGDSPLARTVE